MFERHFYFARVSASENESVLVIFSKDAPSKALQKLDECISIAK
jgi:hypothetical protein